MRKKELRAQTAEKGRMANEGGEGNAKRKEKKKEKYLAICVYIEIICDNIKLRGDREQGNDSEVFNPQKVSIKPIFHNKRICT